MDGIELGCFDGDDVGEFLGCDDGKLDGKCAAGWEVGDKLG